MIPVPVSDLHKSDRFKVYSDSRQEYTVVSSITSGSDEDLLILNVKGRPELVLPRMTTVQATRMYRTVEVPCIGHTVTVLHDKAARPAPVRVICGTCDAKATAEVLAFMAEERVEDNDGEKPFAANANEEG